MLPAQGDDWLSQLLQVLRRQGELCTRLKVDFELADDLTNDAQKSATLLGSLRRRQRFVDEIMRLDRNMEALRHRWREEQQQVPADAREEIEAVATMVRDALDAVSEADGQLIAELKSARERVRADLALITSGRSAHKGYRGGGTHLGSQALSGNALPSNRYLDGCA